MLCDPPTHAFPPHAETGCFEFASHDRNHLTLSKSSSLPDFLEAGSILPSQTDHDRDLIVVDAGFHRNGMNDDQPRKLRKVRLILGAFTFVVFGRAWSQ